MLKTLTELLHKKKPLRCDSCGNVRKSVMGFLSHRSQCQKSANEIENMKVKCHLCGRRMLPVSLSRHMVLSHEKEPTEKSDLVDDINDEAREPGSKRKAAHKYDLSITVPPILLFPFIERLRLYKAITKIFPKRL